MTRTVGARRPRLGQHFLRDIRVAELAVAAADLGPDDVVLEVGPGKGVLTRLLAPRVARVVAVELDPALAAGLEADAIPGVDVIRGDAVHAPLPPFDACVSNLPYQISSPFLFRLLDLPFRVAVLLVQKEFAQRLAARPDTPDYGRLTVNAARRAHVEILRRVPPGAFAPPPRVDSALVRLRPRPPAFDVHDEAVYAKVVDAAFQQRRKKLENALAALPAPLRDRVPGTPHAARRAGELPPEAFADVVAHLLGVGGP